MKEGRGMHKKAKGEECARKRKGRYALEGGRRGMRLKGGGGMHLNEKEGVCT